MVDWAKHCWHSCWIWPLDDLVVNLLPVTRTHSALMGLWLGRSFLQITVNWKGWHLFLSKLFTHTHYILIIVYQFIWHFNIFFQKVWNKHLFWWPTFFLLSRDHIGDRVVQFTLSVTLVTFRSPVITLGLKIHSLFLTLLPIWDLGWKVVMILLLAGR